MFDELAPSTLTGWREDLAGCAGQGASDAQRVDLIRLLEELKAAAAAAQARITVALARSQRVEQAASGVPFTQQGRGVAAQVALARRDSAHRGDRHLGLATALVTEMPFTLAALSAGVISEWRATLMVRETACLSREHRRRVDSELCVDQDRLAGYGDRRLVAEAKKIGYRLDPGSVVARARTAQAERRVTIRPSPDTMTYLTGLLPVAQGVAVYAALRSRADTLVAGGDARNRGQIMADTLVERVTGQAAADQVPLAVNLVITDRALLDADHEPAHLSGYGPVPAGIARTLLGTAERAWLRRLFSSPHTGELVAMDSRARRVPPGIVRFLTARDQTCRTPWCDAPIRDRDHAADHHTGGPTSTSNLQGLCQACNHTKQSHGWQARPRPGPVHTIETTTPTGHRYISTPPEQPGHRRRWIPSHHPGVWTAA